MIADHNFQLISTRRERCQRRCVPAELEQDAYAWAGRDGQDDERPDTRRANMFEQAINVSSG